MNYRQLSSVVYRLSSVFCPRTSTTVENPLQINLFMQNKPNLRKSQMNANLYNTTDYERKRDWTLGESKPNSNPISIKPKMDVNLYIIEDYENETAFRPQKKQTQTNPISNPATVFLRKSACPLVRLSACPLGDALRWGRLTVESPGLLITKEIATA